MFDFDTKSPGIFVWINVSAFLNKQYEAIKTVEISSIDFKIGEEFFPRTQVPILRILDLSIAWRKSLFYLIVLDFMVLYLIMEKRNLCCITL